MKPYYEESGIKIYHCDCRELLALLGDFGCVVIDPPYDDADAVEWASQLPRVETELVFTDPRYLGDITSFWGPPIWVFTWDTMAPWNLGPGRPLTQTKFCLWYGAITEYDRDAALWGSAPAAKHHPSTIQTPLDGRRLTDLWRQSLRWLHHPSAGAGSAGTERFSTRQGDPTMRHAKPLGWVKCLIANTSSGAILDPFMGSGTTLRAAKDLGRAAIGIDIDERCCETAAQRLSQGVLDFRTPV